MVRILIAGLVTASVAGPGLAADAAKGAKVFKNSCSICHAATAGGTKTGPSLYGVVGRTSGTLAGYHYSPAMKSAALVWTDAQLDTYLASPKKVVTGTKMSFGGMPDATKRADLIAYLDTLK